MVENELTFLIKKIPENLEKQRRSEIKQGYFSDFPSPLRIRSENDQVFTLTKKVKINDNDCSRYNETNLPIKKEEFFLLWKVCPKKLAKKRYFYPLGDLTAEVDVFQGKLEGFAMVEVEFPNEESRSRFTPPDWFGEDITQGRWAANSVLSTLSFDEINTLIEKKNHQTIKESN